MSNPLIDVLRRGGCSKGVCTTCGGIFQFLADLKQFLVTRNDLPDLLSSVTKRDIDVLPHRGGELIDLLGRLDHASLDTVLQAWERGPASHPKFAGHLRDSEVVHLATRSSLKTVVEDALLTGERNDLAVRAVWSAVSDLEHHFAKLGGSGRYSGYDHRDPLLLLGLVIVLAQKRAEVLTLDWQGHTQIGRKIETALRDLTSDSTALRGCEAWVPLDLFPDRLLQSVRDQLLAPACDLDAARGALANCARRAAKRGGERSDRAWLQFMAWLGRHRPAGGPAGPQGLTPASSKIDPALITAYRETHYRVFAPVPLTLRVGVRSESLAEAHRANGVTSSAFLTAWNPHSKQIDEVSNAARQAGLRADMRRRGLAFVEGVGEHPSNGWPGEPSLLVFGLTRTEARTLGTQLEQNGIVWSGADARPRLILLR